MIDEKETLTLGGFWWYHDLLRAFGEYAEERKWGISEYRDLINWLFVEDTSDTLQTKEFIAEFMASEDEGPAPQLKDSLVGVYGLHALCDMLLMFGKYAERMNLTIDHYRFLIDLIIRSRFSSAIYKIAVVAADLGWSESRTISVATDLLLFLKNPKRISNMAAGFAAVYGAKWQSEKILSKETE